MKHINVETQQYYAALCSSKTPFLLFETKEEIKKGEFISLYYYSEESKKIISSIFEVKNVDKNPSMPNTLSLYLSPYS